MNLQTISSANQRRLLAFCLALFAAFLVGPASNPSAGASQDGGITPRIIGGTLAPSGSWPSQVAMLFASEADPYQAQFCGGTLIDEGWVLTAAHCVDFFTSPSQLQVAIGINDLSAISSGDRKAIRSISIHPDWDPDSSEWDFALLELALPSGGPVTDLIVPSEAGETVAGEPARIAGWGCTVIGTRDDCRLGGFPSDLREATVAFIGDAECSSSWPADPSGFSFDAEMMICAGIYPAGGVDTCIGDSGGPLTALVDGRRVLAGVTSWGGLPCGLPSSPGVYARVLSAREWIVLGISSEYWLEVRKSGTGDGAVTSEPAGIACGSTCSTKVTAGETIELRAAGAAGSTFAGWSGDCSGTGACEVSMDRGRDVVASFTKQAAPEPDPEPPNPDPQPPEPTAPTVSITAKPAKRTAKSRATFRFLASQPGSTFQCRLDGRSWQRCGSPKTYRNLKRGRKHTFRVKATKSGITGPVRKYSWTIRK